MGKIKGKLITDSQGGYKLITKKEKDQYQINSLGQFFKNYVGREVEITIETNEEKPKNGLLGGIINATRNI